MTRLDRQGWAGRRGSVILLAGALVACGSREPIVEGSPQAPAAFGVAEAPWFGCAPVGGLYAWPPIQGDGDDGRDPHRPRTPLPVLMPTDLALFPEAQLWIDDRRVFRLNSRLVNRDPNRGIRSLTTAWSFHELDGVACEDGRWTWTAPPADDGSPRAAIEQARRANSGAETLTGGMVVQRMAGGRLAIGQWQRLRYRADGRQGPPEAGESALDPPDRVIWHWSLLERLGDTGEGVPPDDAALKPGGSPATR